MKIFRFSAKNVLIFVMCVKNGFALLTTSSQSRSSMVRNPQQISTRMATGDNLLMASNFLNISPIALCAGTASLITGFEIGIIAGALLLLAPEFKLDESPRK